ncbi:MAG TPA: hypothetical protein VNX21_02510 [Candidatus Thermoplasmatota archaeon]|nr:hypothetical protein [Candidatus Thermoplasmatota archaeon]
MTWVETLLRALKASALNPDLLHLHPKPVHRLPWVLRTHTGEVA